jgi:hypothetical protein
MSCRSQDAQPRYLDGTHLNYSARGTRDGNLQRPGSIQAKLSALMSCHALNITAAPGVG